jgi:hypothetical protein
MQIATIIEAIMTVTVVVVFMVFGLLAWRVLRRTQQLLQAVSLRIRQDDAYTQSVAKLAMEKGRRMQRRVECVVVVVFLTFVFRATFACMHAYSFVGIERREDCDQCGDCQSLAFIMHVWFDCNPQVQILAGVLSSPVALLLALSTMMGQQEQELLLTKQQQPVSSVVSMAKL